MEKRMFGFIAVMALVLGMCAGEAFALNCVSSQKLGGSDFCETSVRVTGLLTKTSNEGVTVSIGQVLVYDLTEGTVDGLTYQVELADASADFHIVAGVAQVAVASGQLTNVRQRGKTRIQLAKVGNGVASGDALYVSSTEGAVSNVGTAGTQIGFALEASDAGEETIDAYLTIV